MKFHITIGAASVEVEGAQLGEAGLRLRILGGALADYGRVAVMRDAIDDALRALRLARVAISELEGRE